MSGQRVKRRVRKWNCLNKWNIDWDNPSAGNEIDQEFQPESRRWSKK